jgi:hypothetical protein
MSTPDVIASHRVTSRTMKFAMALALLAYTMVFAEVFIRLLAPQAIMPRYVTGTPWGVRGNVPGAVYRHQTAEVSVEFRINRHGMRDPRDFAFEKPAGTCRVALFGDSYLMGYELSLEQSIAYLIEQRLLSAGYRAEVLNFAVSGAGTSEMLRTFEGSARRFDPDVVVFQFHGSDYGDNLRSRLLKLNNGQVVPDAPSYLPSTGLQDRLMANDLTRFISDRSHLYALVRERVAQAAKVVIANINQVSASKLPLAAAPAEDDETGLDPRSVALTDAIMRHSADLVRSDGRDFMMIGIPTMLSRTKFGDTLAPIPPTTRAEVGMVWPLAALEKAARSDTQLYFEKGHRHLTPLGAQIVVDEIMTALTRLPRMASCRLLPS